MTARFEVRALINGEGWVIVDTAWEHPMIGPYPRAAHGKLLAMSRAAEFEADPSSVPPGDSDLTEDDLEDEGWAPPPYVRGKLRFMREKCSTCVFRPGNRMDLDPGRVAGMLRDVRRDDGYIPCHKTLGAGIPTAICKGGDEAHEGQLARVARRLGADVYVSEADVAAEIEAARA